MAQGTASNSSSTATYGFLFFGVASDSYWQSILGGLLGEVLHPRPFTLAFVKDREIFKYGATGNLFFFWMASIALVCSCPHINGTFFLVSFLKLSSRSTNLGKYLFK